MHAGGVLPDLEAVALALTRVDADPGDRGVAEVPVVQVDARQVAGEGDGDGGEAERGVGPQGELRLQLVFVLTGRLVLPCARPGRERRRERKEEWQDAVTDSHAPV